MIKITENISLIIFYALQIFRNIDKEVENTPGVKSRFIGKDPDAGKVCRQKEKGATEDEMV